MKMTISAFHWWTDKQAAQGQNKAAEKSRNLKNCRHGRALSDQAEIIAVPQRIDEHFSTQAAFGSYAYPKEHSQRVQANQVSQTKIEAHGSSSRSEG